MQAWLTVWRKGIEPQLSVKALTALGKALETDDPRLLQGATTSPPPLQCMQEWAVEAACALGYCGWQGEGLGTVAEVESYFAQKCFQADQKMGDSAMVRWFLQWFDDTPRYDMIRLLLPEVETALLNRSVVNEAG